MNFLEGELGGDGEAIWFTGGVGRLLLPPQPTGCLRTCDKRTVILGIRPQHVRLLTPGSSSGPDNPGSPSQTPTGSARHEDGSFAVVPDMPVTLVEPLGDSIQVHSLTNTGEPVVARVPRGFTASPGERINLAIDIFGNLG